MGWFDKEENSSGAIAGRLATDAAHIRGAVADFAGMICQNICTLIAAYAIAFSYNWKMTLVVTAMVPLIAFGFIVQNKLMMGYGQKVGNTLDALYRCCCDHGLARLSVSRAARWTHAHSTLIWALGG